MGKREIKHAHASCLHEELEYCRHCNLVYCEGCDITWRQYGWSYQNIAPLQWQWAANSQLAHTNQSATTNSSRTIYGDPTTHSALHGQISG